MRSLWLVAAGTGSLMGSLLSGLGSEVCLCTASGISSAFNVMSNIISSALVLSGTHLKLVSNPAKEASTCVASQQQAGHPVIAVLFRES